MSMVKAAVKTESCPASRKRKARSPGDVQVRWGSRTGMVRESRE